MNVEAVKKIVQQVMIEELDIEDAELLGNSDPVPEALPKRGFSLTGEVKIGLSKPAANGTQRLSVTIFHHDDTFIIVGSIDPALEIVSLELYKKTGSRILDIE